MAIKQCWFSVHKVLGKCIQREPKNLTPVAERLPVELSLLVFTTKVSHGRLSVRIPAVTDLSRACRRGRLNWAVLRMRRQKPSPRVISGVAL